AWRQDGASSECSNQPLITMGCRASLQHVTVRRLGPTSASALASPPGVEKMRGVQYETPGATAQGVESGHDPLRMGASAMDDGAGSATPDFGRSCEAGGAACGR